jgi:uncharacterized phage-associated protein
MARLSALEVADYFLTIAKSDPEEKGICPLKLQKLVYYAQGWYLALNDKRLFDDEILAWKHGPVVREIWDKYNGSKPIVLKKPADVKKYPMKVKQFLGRIFKLYAQFSAWRLREMTHDEEPWKDTPRNCEIEQEVMKTYFKSQLV